ncbi:MAG TPA: hypothetical protein PKH33_16865 [bacterium]|nr:hypothetical protein [bacterium]
MKTDSKGHVYWFYPFDTYSWDEDAIGIFMRNDNLFAVKSTPENDPYTIVKLNTNGETVWRYKPDYKSYGVIPNELIFTKDGGAIIMHSLNNIYKLNNNGTIDGSLIIDNSGFRDRVILIESLGNGRFITIEERTNYNVIESNKSDSGFKNNYYLVMYEDFRKLWRNNIYVKSEYSYLQDANIYTINDNRLMVSINNEIHMYKNDGSFLWSTRFGEDASQSCEISFLQSEDMIVLCGNIYDKESISLFRLNKDGDIQWNKKIKGTKGNNSIVYDDCRKMIIVNDNIYLAYIRVNSSTEDNNKDAIRKKRSHHLHIIKADGQTKTDISTPIEGFESACLIENNGDIIIMMGGDNLKRIDRYGNLIWNIPSIKYLSTISISKNDNIINGGSNDKSVYINIYDIFSGKKKENIEIDILDLYNDITWIKNN